MQSIAPTIIRHYLPIDFSHQLLDSQRSPRRSFVPREDNPLQNIKLRALDRNPAPEIVLTFTNRSSRQFQAKKQLTYRQLFRELHEEAQKMEIMQSVAGRVEEEAKPKRQRTGVSGRGRSEGLYRSATAAEEGRRTGSRSARRIYSSINFRQAKVVMEGGNERSDRENSQHSPIRKNLRVRGSKAPEGEMVDHLRRNASQDEYNILNRHGQR